MGSLGMAGGVQMLLRQQKEDQDNQTHSDSSYYSHQQPQAQAQAQAPAQAPAPPGRRNSTLLNPQLHPPPSIPLPPLPSPPKLTLKVPMSKTRTNDASPRACSGSGGGGGGGGGIPVPRSITSSPAVPTVRTFVSSPTPSSSSSRLRPVQNLRKTVSIEAFPRPPGSINSNLPLSTPTLLPRKASSPDIRPTTTPASATLRKMRSKPSLYALRANASTTNLGPLPSNGNIRPDSLLSLPSPSMSRASSAPDSPPTPITPATDHTIPEEREMDDDDRRGKEAKGNVLVSVRVRPDAATDTQPDGEWLVDGRRSLISYEGGEHRYDNVFSPHDNNSRVYESAAKRLVRRVMEGYHGTVFAYGMTGTGKTFSMQGTAVSPGVIPLAITDIFSYIRQNPGREFLLRVSYLEIYNEKIYDLLNPESSEEIKLREDPRRGVYATPLKEEIVQSPNQLLRVIARGDQQRRTGSTQFNARSSRSHAVVQIVVESRERTAVPIEENRRDKLLPGSVLVSTLSLIDLAGSEKAADNKERRTEGGHINKSLLTLGNVIARISSDKELSDKEQKHLPYRDSKLTRLLQPALSGNSLVSILCTVQLSSASTSAAATSSHTSETLNTLKFASRAKNNLVSHAKRNESNPTDGSDPKSRALLDRYKIEILELRSQLDEAKNNPENTAAKADDEEEERWRERERESAERHEEQMLEMQLARTALKERISHLNRLILSSKSAGVNSERYSSASSNLPFAQRFSFASTVDRPRSRRQGSTESQGNMSRVVSGSTTAGTLPIARTSQMELASASEDDMDEDVVGEEPVKPGHASSARRIRALQADLADKNQYIATLEKRLLQTKNTNNYSKTSSTRSPATSPALSQGKQDAGNAIKEKDHEIEQLRQKLEDQTRMVTALRNAARKRDMLESLSQHPAFRSDPAAASPNSIESRTPVKKSSRPNLTRSYSGPVNNHLSLDSQSSPHKFSRLTDSDVPNENEEGDEDNSGSPTKPARVSKGAAAGERKTLDEMTKLLDEMIQDKVETGHVIRGDRGSLRIKRDTVMSRGGEDKHDAEEGAKEAASHEKALYGFI